MKKYSQYKLFIFIYLLLFFLLVFESFAQGGFSSASYNNQRETNFIPTPEKVVVEEYFNYHQHQIALPKKGENLAMELKWSNAQTNPIINESILQIGFATPKISNDLSQIPPLNLTLIVDRSGSMADANKMDKAKEALKTFVKKLRKSDLLSIVEFSSDAKVLIPAQSLENLELFEKAIASLYPSGGTNIEAGLNLGYQEVLKNYHPDKTNRVILITDGQSNIGTIDPEKITQNTAEQNYIKNINLSAIGVGVDYNSELLRSLVKSGRGQIHFVANDGDIKKILIDEIGSLLAPVCRNIQLTIQFDENLKLKTFYGYNPNYEKNKITLFLEDMNADLTQIVLAHFAIQDIPKNQKMDVEVKLSYFDIQMKKQIERQEKITLNFSSSIQTDYAESYQAQKESKKTWQFIENEDIKKNYAIAFMAQNIQTIAKLYVDKQLKEAEKLVKQSILQIKTAFPNLQDQDIQKVLTMLEKYEGILAKE